MYLDLPYLVPKRKDTSFASLSITLSHGYQQPTSLCRDSEGRHSELKECEGNVRSRGHHLGGVGKGVHSRPQPSTKRTSSVLASISSVWNVIGGSRDLCVPESSMSSYIIAELPKPPILDSLVSFQRLLSLGVIAPRQGILHVTPEEGHSVTTVLVRQLAIRACVIVL